MKIAIGITRKEANEIVLKEFKILLQHYFVDITKLSFTIPSCHDNFQGASDTFYCAARNMQSKEIMYELQAITIYKDGLTLHPVIQIS